MKRAYSGAAPLMKNIVSYLMKLITCGDVKRILKSLKKDKSPGPDGITPILLNELAEEISYRLTKIFQASLESGRLPKDWLTANVSPICKDGQHVDPKNAWSRA